MSQKKFLVVHVLNGLPLGGNENLCLQLIQNSPPNLRHVLINLDPKRLDMLPLFEEIPNLKINYQPYNKNRRLEFITNLVIKFRQIRPQAVYIYPFGVHIFVGLAARLANVPLIVTRAGNPVPNEPIMKKKWKKILQVSCFLKIPIYYCSKTVEKDLKNLTKNPNNSITILSGRNIQKIEKRAQKTRLNKNSKLLIIGMVARFNRIKDQETLIRAFSIINSKFPKTRLWLIGDGNEKEKLYRLTESLDLQSVIVFLGKRTDIPELLGQMDIYAFSTTKDEGLGMALVEAMAARLPVIASDVPACREVLNNGEAGILVPQKDPVALASALEKVLVSKTEMDYWRQRSYQHASVEYSIDQCAKRWYKLLNTEPY